jgi:Lon protease-like protein
MTNFIPIFPLSIVAYPAEYLNLHIFEDRYKQLINDCFTNGKSFGIPVVINEKVQEFGTLMRVVEIVETYADGRMDIKTKGISIFRILETIQHVPDKLYYGAIVKHLDNDEARINITMQYILNSVKELHKHLNVTKDFKKPEAEMISYDIAHHIGFTLDEEYELLQLLREDQRLEYLKRYLNKVLAVMVGMDKLKEKIQLNGHFKELKGFNFDF